MMQAAVGLLVVGIIEGALIVGAFEGAIVREVLSAPVPASRGSTRKNAIFSNSLWINSEYPNLLKNMFMVPVNFR